jgi:hypothetical protein
MPDRTRTVSSYRVVAWLLYVNQTIQFICITDAEINQQSYEKFLDRTWPSSLAEVEAWCRNRTTIIHQSSGRVSKVADINRSPEGCIHVLYMGYMQATCRCALLLSGFLSFSTGR